MGAVSGKKVQLREVYIIAEDKGGEIKAMTVKGFEPVNVLDSRLQIDGTRSIILSTEVGEGVLRISWDRVGDGFVVGKGVPASLPVTYEQPASVKKDNSVFNE
jgi:hypothetical protein